MQKFKDILPQEARQELSSVVEEGKTVARTSLQAALDAADSAARSMATAITMHRRSWLQSLGFPEEVQQTVQDFPFKRPLLFSEETDAKLHRLKDSKMTLKSLGLYTPVVSRKHYRPQQTGRYFAQLFWEDQQRKKNQGFGHRSPPPTSSSGPM